MKPNRSTYQRLEPQHINLNEYQCEHFDDEKTTDVEKTEGEEALKSVAPPPTAQTARSSGAPEGAI